MVGRDEVAVGAAGKTCSGCAWQAVGRGQWERPVLPVVAVGRRIGVALGIFGVAEPRSRSAGRPPRSSVSAGLSIAGFGGVSPG